MHTVGPMVLWLLLGAPPAEPPDFAREVRPILAQYCFKCHGPDDKTRKAKLRFDEPASARNLGVIVPGKPADSELVTRIQTTEVDKVMPPPATKMALSAKQKEILERWVAAGAEYRQHWAFVKPAKAALPQLKMPVPAGWGSNPIDAFLLAGLEKEGLKPSPEADRVTLIRRLSLDLIGLPPTPAEVDAFVNDTGEQAYDRLVERMLASPQYGERWARRWLDLARYADTNGYEKDRTRSIWPYRDWVIQALNADMPFDQFTLKQIAGDLLPGATQEDRIATGFHRNTMLNEEGGIDPLEYRFHAMTDRMATTGTVWLGLTLGCAQCHTHKYDPISHREYYQLFAFLNNTDEPTMPVTSADTEKRRAEIEARLKQLRAELANKFSREFGEGAAREAKIEEAFKNWLMESRGKVIPWQIVKPASMKTNSPLLTLQPDDSIFVSGDITKSDEYQLQFAGKWGGVTGVRVEALPDERLPRGGPGAVYYEGALGDFTLSEISATADGKPARFVKASQTYASGGFNALAAIDGNPQTGWGVDGGQGKRHVAVFVFDKPLEESVKDLQIKMIFERHFAADIGRFRLSVTRSPNPEARDTLPAIEKLLLIPDDKLTADERKGLREEFYLRTPLLETARKEINDLQNQLPHPPTTLVMRERPAENPRPTYVHRRGEFLQADEPVSAATPAFLPGLPQGQAANRLSFARWLVSPDNPLTARVIVNRNWSAFLGKGLVRTTEDFGYQGQMPSHPELLDWLALDFMEHGWSLKKLHRLIVTSAAYRQSSKVTPELLQKDPENRLLARGPRVRLEAEIIRDSVLKAAGLLSLKMGGPGVYPPQPGSVTTEGTYGALAWTPNEGEDRYRRGLYTFAKRTAPFAMLATFDGPSGEACVARRDVSNTPLQALTLLNDVVFTEAAQAVGRTMVAEMGSLDERLTRLFRRFLARSPAQNEIALFKQFFEERQKQFQGNPAEADKLAGKGTGSTADRAAWAALARVLMNLDEFVNKN